MKKDKSKIKEWLSFAREQKKSHLLIIEQTYKGIKIPVYINRKEDLEKTINDYSSLSKVNILEIYNTNLDPNIQLNSVKNWEK